MVIRSVFLIFLTLSLFTACEEPYREADISNIPSQVEVLSLRDTLATTSPTIQQLYQTFGTFWRDYTEDILRIGPADNPETLNKIAQFLTDPTISELEGAIADVHGNQLSNYGQELDDAFRRYHFFFPESKPPQVIFMNSGFNFGIYPIDGQLGIGLDFYLGGSHPMTETLDPNLFPLFLKKKMEPEYLVGDAMRGWMLVNHQKAHYDDTNLLSTAMYWGKTLYLMDLLFPESADHLKINFTPEDIAWCQANERNLWLSFSNQDVLYERRKFEVNRWIEDGPFTRAADLPQEAPSRMGQWICWQVVRDYMARNKDVTPEMLLAETNYLKMLNSYRPD